jgi:hypothetical protein
MSWRCKALFEDDWHIKAAMRMRIENASHDVFQGMEKPVKAGLQD